MTEEIIIDVSSCPHKSDDDCMEVPICNEYGDLMGYQSCEAQTLCPYRSQKKIERLEQENKELKDENIEYDEELAIEKLSHKSDLETLEQYRSALEEIREIAENAKEGRYTTKSEDYTEGMHTIGCYVLDKINEVLNVKH